MKGEHRKQELHSNVNNRLGEKVITSQMNCKYLNNPKPGNDTSVAKEHSPKTDEVYPTTQQVPKTLPHETRNTLAGMMQQFPVEVMYNLYT